MSVELQTMLGMERDAMRWRAVKPKLRGLCSIACEIQAILRTGGYVVLADQVKAQAADITELLHNA